MGKCVKVSVKIDVNREKIENIKILESCIVVRIVLVVDFDGNFFLYVVLGSNMDFVIVVLVWLVVFVFDVF